MVGYTCVLKGELSKFAYALGRSVREESDYFQNF